MSANVSSDRSGMPLSSAQPLRPLRLGGEVYEAGVFTAEHPSPSATCRYQDETGFVSKKAQRSPRWRRDLLDAVIDAVKRRWARERRRRKVGRAYDMAFEIARVIPRGFEVLDVGCGNGFIAHHLSAMLGTSVVGIDLGNSAEAPIDYCRYDGWHFPLPNDSVDAVLLCYVLHHAQDIHSILGEMRRVLRDGGFALIYEDIPQTRWDRFICALHSLQWKNRCGRCTFRSDSHWRLLFESSGFEVLTERSLSRWRNLTHPVCRRLYLLKGTDSIGSKRSRSSAYQAEQVARCSRTTELELYESRI